MPTLLCSIYVTENGVFLENENKSVKKFEDLFLCCCYLNKHGKSEALEGSGQSEEIAEKFKRKLELKEEDGVFWWEMKSLDGSDLCSTKALGKNSLEDLLVNILINHIRDSELSEISEGLLNECFQLDACIRGVLKRGCPQRLDS